jgi:hypothetical protein
MEFSFFSFFSFLCFKLISLRITDTCRQVTVFGCKSFVISKCKLLSSRKHSQSAWIVTDSFRLHCKQMTYKCKHWNRVHTTWTGWSKWTSSTESNIWCGSYMFKVSRKRSISNLNWCNTPRLLGGIPDICHAEYVLSALMNLHDTLEQRTDR